MNPTISSKSIMILYIKVLYKKDLSLELKRNI